MLERDRRAVAGHRSPCQASCNRTHPRNPHRRYRHCRNAHRLRLPPASAPASPSGSAWAEYDIGHLHSVDPLAAANLVDGMHPQTAEGLVNAVANNLALRDPGAAADWVLTQPESRIRASTLGNVDDSWSRQDATAAERWGLRLPSEDERDSALQVARCQGDPESTAAAMDNVRNDAFVQHTIQLRAIVCFLTDPKLARCRGCTTPF